MTKFVLLFVVLMSACVHAEKMPETSAAVPPAIHSEVIHVNGTDIYCEIWGKGEPLVLLHGGGSDMYVSFGKAIPVLAKQFRVIAIDEQGHGKSPALTRRFGFVQTADDIASVLEELGVRQASFVGFSNGATTGMYLAMKHPELIKRMVLQPGLYSKDGAFKGFWEGMAGGSIDSMPQELKDAYVKRAVHPEDLPKMFAYDANRMKTFKDIPSSSMRKVSMPVLIMQGDHDVPTLEHGLRITRLLPKGRFAVLPGQHDNYLGDVSHGTPEMTAASLAIITEFLNAKD